MYAFPDAEEAGVCDRVYQYDSLGDCAHISPPFGANLFQAEADSFLTEVGFYLLHPRSTYEISVYTGCVPGNPVSGTCVLTQAGTRAWAGFHAVPLERKIPLQSGERFSVVLRFSPVFGDNSLAVEYAEKGYSSKASAWPGESFYSISGQPGTWKDLQTVSAFNGTGNLCIKAYVRNVASSDAPAGMLAGSFRKQAGPACRSCPLPRSDGGQTLRIMPANPAYLSWLRDRNRQDAGEGKPSGGGAGRADRPLGWIPSMVDYSYLGSLPRWEFREASSSASSLPVRYDMRQHERLTPVKNQQPYGTCWAHATMGAMESALMTQKRGRFDFSEKHLANTHGCDPGFSQGGNGSIALAYLTRWAGPIAESEDPYPDWEPYKKAKGVPQNVVVPASPVGTPVGHLQNAVCLTPMQTASDTDGIKQAVLDHGGVYASYIDLGAAHSDDGRTYYWNGDLELVNKGDGGHAVLIVGWDDAYPRSKFKYTPPGDGAFLAKNSWGTGFGDAGYYWVSYWDVTFGRKELWAFHGLESPDNYGDLYCHDSLGCSGQCGLGETTWGANMFVARRNDAVAAVGFHANVPGTRYEIAVHAGCTASDPVSGRRGATRSGITDHAGYVTVPLDTEVPIRQGERFSVVFKLTTPSHDCPLSYEAPQIWDPEGNEWVWTHMSKATAFVGESFFSGDGVHWTDFTEVYPKGNLCFKAYTKPHGAVADDSGPAGTGDGPTPPPSSPEQPDPAPAPQGIWRQLGSGAFK